MNYPDWREFALKQSVLREPNAEPDRAVFWIATSREAGVQYWERIASVSRAQVTTTNDGLSAIPAISISARQKPGGFMSRLINRVHTSTNSRQFQLPDGRSAEQCGERRSDLFLVWSAGPDLSLEQARLEATWPQAKEFLELGANLFVVRGLPSTAAADAARAQMSTVPAPPGTDNPLAHAEAILAAARSAGARDREATALADIGIINLNQGNPQKAITALEQALSIARGLGDRARESDSAGNLGLALLAVRQVEHARGLFEQTLAHARSTANPFEEKLALERLGIVAWTTRDYRGALELFGRALEIAQQVGDRQQIANLLWHLGIQFAELGQREAAIEKAEEAISLFHKLGKPQAATYGAYLQKYRMGLSENAMPESPGKTLEPAPQAYLGGSIVASVMANEPSAPTGSAKPTVGPGLLRMAMSATKAAAAFAGSGFKTASADTQRIRLQTCAGCEHHTGVRCRVCGCFTSAKSKILHEDCPIGKWPK
jgi:tetratricopeptide (TPR) repeat protein